MIKGFLVWKKLEVIANFIAKAIAVQRKGKENDKRKIGAGVFYN